MDSWLIGAVPSPHVEQLCDHFKGEKYNVEKVRVPYEFQRGGNLMLKIRKVEQLLPANSRTPRG